MTWSDERLKLIEAAVSVIINKFEIPSKYSGGLKQTPMRVAKMYNEMLSGYNTHDAAHILTTNFNDEQDTELSAYDQMIQVRNIQFWSMCEHHMCPFFGYVHIGYIPKEKIVGLSKLPRLVEVYAKRLQVQERMTQQIMNDIIEYIDPMGAMVVIEATHTCCVMRGVKTPEADTVTSQCYGAMFKNSTARLEYLTLLTRGRK